MATHRPVRRRTRWGAVAVAALVAALPACSEPGPSADGVVTIELFQNKSEAIELYDELIADFEAANPGIRVAQNNVPDSLSVLRSRLVKNDPPEVVAINGDQNFRGMAQAGVFRDYAGSPALDGLNPVAVDTLRTLAQNGEEVNGVPITLNAQVLLYNADLFEQAGLAVPRTWDEVVAVSRAIQDAGGTPFAFTYKDAWTAQAVWNTITPQTLPEGFWDDLRAGDAALTDATTDAATKMVELLDYANADPFGTDYNAGNTAMANGEAFMYLQGIWAIPAIRAVNPDVRLGATVVQWAGTDEPATMVSGLDQILTTVEGAEHQAEADRFIEYLTTPEAQRTLSAGLAVFSAREDVVPDDELLAGLKPYLDEGRIVDFPEHELLTGVNLGGALQTFLYSRDPARLGTTLQSEWDAAYERESL
ncbi:ABC transporter substrate-binding protein [Cellulomonas endometrii]|uniref:ABC transporter substrate-binding protein n=1 Tax=Cellulomonas endometrii TaxID=3036301 RepID=UPI0024AC9333|nr:extracellular solute-binding protein [Cellulomonas endometrii]